MILSVRNIVQEYKTDKGLVRIVDDVTLEYDKPGINFLMGPSGCGKTTLMRLMGGVRPTNVVTPTRGTIHIDGKLCYGPHPDVVTIFQKSTNFPFKTVRQNVNYSFELGEWANRIDYDEQQKRLDWILEKVGLTDRQDNRPAQLSGGQNQRVALASAFVMKPRILLMDEPFVGLDPNTLKGMQKLLVELQEEVGCLVIFVGHDVEEALFISDRITVLTSKPAVIAKDFVITTPKALRTDDWMDTNPLPLQIEKEILHIMRQTK